MLCQDNGSIQSGIFAVLAEGDDGCQILITSSYAGCCCCSRQRQIAIQQLGRAGLNLGQQAGTIHQSSTQYDSFHGQHQQERGTEIGQGIDGVFKGRMMVGQIGQDGSILSRVGVVTTTTTTTNSGVWSGILQQHPFRQGHGTGNAFDGMYPLKGRFVLAPRITGKRVVGQGLHGNVTPFRMHSSMNGFPIDHQSDAHARSHGNVGRRRNHGG
mmetsp:Transcript_13013/g.36018  ORF Transcript_13013/g.36018 Transcript_13013/m.36018 type:complete len:213 (+) Transcript_13013:372-1010(+)